MEGSDYLASSGTESSGVGVATTYAARAREETPANFMMIHRWI